MRQRLFPACVAFALSAPVAGDETIRVLLLGGSATLSEDAPAGVRYEDWIRAFLEPGLSAKLEVVNAGVREGTVKAGREEAARRLSAKPEVIVLGFGLEDALRSSSAEFRREYKGLLEDIESQSPASKVVLATATPLDARHRLAAEERFREAGGIDKHLRSGFVEPVRDLAEKKKLPLVDQYRLIDEAVQAGENLESLVQTETGLPAPGGNLLLGRSTALSILFLLDRRDSPPSVQEVLGGEGPASSPAAAELSPVLAVWPRVLEPIWLSRLRDEDPEVRLGALRTLLQAETIPPDFLGLVLGFLEPGDEGQGRPSDVEQLLAAAVGAGLVTREKVAEALVALIRRSRLNSPAAASAFPFLVNLSNGKWGGGTAVAQSRRRPTRVVRSPVPGARPPTLPPGAGLPAPVVPGAPAPPLPAGAPQGAAGVPLLRWSDEDLALFADALSAREASVRGSAVELLNSTGESGWRRVLEEVKRGTEKVALEFLVQLWQLKKGEAGAFRDAYLAMARGDQRESVRLKCLELVLALPAPEIPLDLLRELFNRESGNLLLRSAQLLAAHGPDGMEVLVSKLKADEEDRVQLSRTGLFYLGLYSSSDELGNRAMAALIDHLTPARQKELLEYLETTLQKSSPPLLCQPAPAGVQVIPGRGKSAPRAVRRALAPAPAQIQPASWPVETGEPRVDRLQDFLPRVEKSLLEGTDEEKEAAERILHSLWQTARKLEAGKPQSQGPLADRLQKEAREGLKKDDPQLFLRKARQAIAAGAGAEAIRSLAWTLATTSRDDLRDPREAETWAREAIARGGRKPVYLDTLAASLAGQGKFKEAVELELEALQEAADEQKTAFTARAILYLSGKPVVAREKK